MVTLINLANGSELMYKPHLVPDKEKYKRILVAMLY